MSLVQQFTSEMCSVQQLLVEYPKCFVVAADNVGSKQMQRIRIALRGSAGTCVPDIHFTIIVSILCSPTFKGKFMTEKSAVVEY